MQTINLDLSVKSIIPVLYAKQADVGRKFKAILTDSGVAYPVPHGSAVSIWYSGSSGDGNYTDVGANSAVTVSGNEIVVEMIAQMLTNYGVGTVCIVINAASGDQLGMWNIPYMVEPLPGMGSTAAKEYFTAFSNAVKDLAYPDASLTAAGKAADAAAVGAALTTKAPDGYGLGETTYSDAIRVRTLSEVDALVNNGWYQFDGSGEYLNGISSCAIEVIASRYGVTQIQYVNQLTHAGCVARRSRYDTDTWDGCEWEWVNPPMTVDVEYRTTERWNGNPVYTKMVDCLTLVTGSHRQVEYSGGTSVIRWSGYAGQFALPYNPPDGGTEYYIIPVVANNKIEIFAGSDISAYHTYVQVWYIK